MMNTVKRRGMPPTMLRAMRMSSTRRPNMTMRRASMTMMITARRTACQMLNSAKGRSDHSVNSIN